MSEHVFETEPFTYEAKDGKTYKALRVWHVEPPGPVGSGIQYKSTVIEDRLVDGVYERHVYAWKRWEDYNPAEGVMYSLNGGPAEVLRVEPASTKETP